MALYPITVNTSSESPAHIYAEDDAAIYCGIFRDDCVLDIGEKLKATIESNNLIKLSDGVLCIGGHFARIKYGDTEDVTIENGQSGQKRYDLIVARFQTTGGVDTYEIAVKKGTPSTGTPIDPTITTGDLYKGDNQREFALYRVKIDGLSIESVDQLFHIENTIATLKEYTQFIAPVLSGSAVGTAANGAGYISIASHVGTLIGDYVVVASNGDTAAFAGYITGAHLNSAKNQILFSTSSSVSGPVRVNFAIYRVAAL